MSLPNLILIIPDQQRADTIAASGARWMQTPHLDRLVREGVAFSNCFVTSPVCVASRASLFSGKYPHSTQVFTNWGGTYNVVVGIGDITDDGRPDLVSRDTSGNVWRNNGDGKGSFGSRAQIATGWGGYKFLS